MADGPSPQTEGVSSIEESGTAGPVREPVVMRLEAFLEALPDEAWVKDLEGRYLMVNRRFAAALGRPVGDLIGRADRELFDPGTIEPFEAADRRVLERGERTRDEHWGIPPEDSGRRYETVRAPVRDGDGAIVGVVGISRDVTERYRREERLRSARQQYRRLTETLPDGVFVTDLEGRVVEANRALCRILGRDPADVIGRSFLDFVAPRSRDEVQERHRGRTQVDELYSLELWIRRPGGEERRIETRSTLVVQDGTATGTHGVVRDITEERQRQEAERRMLDVLEATPDIVAIRDAEGALLFTNSSGRDWGTKETDCHAWADVLDLAHPEWAREIVRREGIPTALEHGNWTGETAIVGHDGEEIPISQVIVAGRDEQGEVSHVSTIMRDISPIKAREKALRRRDAILEAVSQAGTEFLRSADWQEGASAGLDRLGEATGVSRLSVLRLDRHGEGDWTATLVLEWTAEGVEPMLGDPLLQDVPAEEAGMSRWVERFRNDQTVYGPVAGLPESERALLRAQGIQSVAAVPVHVRGDLWGMAVFDDCETAREWAPTEIEALRAAAGALGAAIQRNQTEQELADREEELRQSQKMEAVGRLAGGVAHDFNNMLTAIQGFATLLQGRLDADEGGRHYLDEILRAADRSAALTRQLLAFSRKQVMRPRVVDLNDVIRDMETMLRRLLGETITLSTALSDGLVPIRVDPGQLDQVIMNLCVNAKDAMPEGGRLRIGTDTVSVNGEPLSLHDGALEPGDYAELTVEDTGVGLDAAVLDRIFEPFFTTKKAGEGTGLGLATVYGIVSQSGGGVAVSSEPGVGTTFRVYLPACASCELEGSDDDDSSDASRPGGAGGGTVVVVEDEEAVRRLITRVLERADHTVLAAGTGHEALALLREYDGPVHLLLTDVVMPGMGGPELARALRAEHPQLRVCFMSGYTEDEIFRHGLETKGELFLEKPFTPAELRKRVASFLSSDSSLPPAR